MKNQFRIQIKETCERIEYFDTITEAIIQLAKWEKDDEDMEAYTPDFYEIAELTLDGTYIPVES